MPTERFAPVWFSIIRIAAFTAFLVRGCISRTSAEDYGSGQERAWLEGRWWSAQIDDDGCWRFWSDADKRWVSRSELSSSSQKTTRQVFIQECVGDTCKQVVATAIWNDGAWWVKNVGKWQYWRGGKWNARKVDVAAIAGRPANTGRTFRNQVQPVCYT